MDLNSAILQRAPQGKATIHEAQEKRDRNRARTIWTRGTVHTIAQGRTIEGNMNLRDREDKKNSQICKDLGHLKSFAKTGKMPALGFNCVSEIVLSRSPFTCNYPDCLSAASGSGFTRHADLDRHMKSVHSSTLVDCPFKWCGRTGQKGFSRQDHLREHLARMHGGLAEPSSRS